MKKLFGISVLALLLAPAVILVGCGGDDDPGSPSGQPGCSLSLTQPVAGSQYMTGEDCRIRWDQEGSAPVQIDLLKGGELVTTIATVQSREQYGWHATTYGEGSGTDYAIRLTAVGEEGCGDTSGDFEIIDTASCQFAFTFPDTAYLLENQEFLVTWDSQSTSGLVDIELMRLDDPDFPVGSIAANLIDTGEYLWTVDSLHQGTYDHYFLRISDHQVVGCSAVSDDFRMVDENLCTISVLRPQPTDFWTEGTTQTVEFEALDDATSAVNVALYQGMIHCTTIASGVPVMHQYDGLDRVEWVVTDDDAAAPGHTFRIKIADAADGHCVGWSEGFTIVGN